MSRLKNFTRSILSGYAQIAVNVLYTLASIPLALHYLTKTEFGLWALTLQVAGFISLVDLGMGSSVARILIDHKDDRHNGRYGGAIKSGFLVGLAQGLITLVVGLVLVWFLGNWLRLSADLARPFFWLMTGQVLLAGAAFSMRMFGQILYAWQRMDLSNYSGVVQLLVGFATLWMGFQAGFGVFSLLAGTVASWVCGTIINAAACHRLGLWPRAAEWGRVSREQFRELFHYGTGVFFDQYRHAAHHLEPDRAGVTATGYGSGGTVGGHDQNFHPRQPDCFPEYQQRHAGLRGDAGARRMGAPVAPLPCVVHHYERFRRIVCRVVCRVQQPFCDPLDAGEIFMAAAK